MPDCGERPTPALSRAAWILLAAIALGSQGTALRGQDALPYVEAGVGAKQGDFGSLTRSTLWLGYATYGATGPRWDANLTVPFLRLDREGGGVSTLEQGIGDVVVRGLYRFLPESENGWSLDGVGGIKLPTASDTKGLGTGRTDVGGFLALHQRLGNFQWTLLGGWLQGTSTNTAGATGDPTSGAYVAGLSTSWYLDRDRWGLSFEARGASFEGVPGAKEITLDVFHPFTSAWGMKAAFTAGLTSGGPKQSLGVALVRLFP